MSKPVNFPLMVALRYLWSKRSEAFITIITIISVLGVAIGVMVLNIVMAVMTGFEAELKSKITDTNSHIIVRSIGGRLTNWQELSDAIAKIDGIASVSPIIQQQALIRTENKSSGIIIRGLQPGSSSAKQIDTFLKSKAEIEDLYSPMELTIQPSREIEGQNSEGNLIKVPGMVIGQELSRQFGLYVGDMVSVLTPQVASSPFGLVPRFRRFVVTGIYSSGLIDYESGVVYVGLHEAQQFFGLGESVTVLEIRANDLDQTDLLVKAVGNAAGGISKGIYVQDWKENNQALWDALQLEKKVYFIVLLLIVVMASFSIITTLIMLVLEKRKDIAVLRTLGASSRAVSKIFLTQGAVIGFLGTALGLILGLLGCLALREYGFPLDKRIFQMSELPVRIVPMNFIATGLASFLICCLATIYPAKRASQVMPSEALRY